MRTARLSTRTSSSRCLAKRSLTSSRNAGRTPRIEVVKRCVPPHLRADRAGSEPERNYTATLFGLLAVIWAGAILVIVLIKLQI